MYEGLSKEGGTREAQGGAPCRGWGKKSDKTMERNLNYAQQNGDRMQSDAYPAPAIGRGP